MTPTRIGTRATVVVMTASALPTSPLAAGLRAGGFVGRLVEPADADYDSARAGWNGAIDRRPAAVAYASDSDDVAAAVRAAGLMFTIRAGGHSVSGRSVRDGALCIHLRALNAVEVDSRGAVVRVVGGALLSELDAATQEHGLAVPAGQISHTGVGGPDARRRHRLADAPSRSDDRLAAVGRRRPGRRSSRCTAARGVVACQRDIAAAASGDDHRAARRDRDCACPVGTADIGDHLAVGPEAAVGLSGRREPSGQRRESQGTHDARDTRETTHCSL